jgi:post-segregation antitoxin (ccd killing protein)
MFLRMTTRRRTSVTPPDDLLAHARTASGGNVSAYVERALRAQQLREDAVQVRAWREHAGSDAEELADIFGEDIA